MAEQDAMDAQKRAAQVARRCDHSMRIGLACEECLPLRLHRRRDGRGDAPCAQYVDTLGSESGYTHVDTLVAHIRAGRGSVTEKKR